MEPAMTGKKLKITRSYESSRFAPPKTIDSRALDFLKTQNFKIDFSASISTKALNSKTKPAADNKPKRKKASGPIKRYGVAVFDPNARWTPGKVFIPWIMKHNRMMGDEKPNVGWIEAPKTIEPKNVSQTVKNLIAINKNKPGYKFRDSKPNPRTGGFEQKALGPSIGTIIPGGDIGARAASKLGLVVDSLGKLRCPPGVPAANQFTDSIGSNCFDFMPDVAKRLLGEAIQFGREQMSHLSLVNNMEQTVRRQNGLIVPSDNNLVVSSSKNLILPHILGPDGKILSTVTTIEPIIYAETVRAQLARDYPNIDMEERERIVKLAEQKAGMIQGVNSRIKIALDYLKELGIEFDENNPQSLTAGLISAIKKLKEDGWDIDYQNLLWGANLDTDSSLSMDEKVALHARGVIDTAVRIVLGNPERHFSEEELSKIFPDLSGDPDINIKRIANAISNNDLSRLGPGQKKVALKVMERVNDYWATEHGFLMSILAEHKQNPIDMELVQTFGLMDPTDPDNFGTEAMVIPTKDGKLGMFFNPIGMMMNEPPSMPTDGKWRMYTGDGKGLEIEQIQAISRVVDAGQRKQLLNEFLRQTNDSAKEVDEVIGANASKHLNSIMEKNAGKLGRAMWVFQHELTHARQYSLLAYLISHDPKGRRLKGMTNADVFSLVDELIGGRNSILNMESILSDPKIISSAFAEMGPIVEKLVENGMAGVYPQQHLNALNILSEILNLPPSQRIDAADKIAQEVDSLQKAKDANFITPKENQRLNALIYAENAIIEILNNPENNTLESAIRQQRALMFAEAIAELNASVKMGLIQPTDEIKQVLEHINGPMDQVHKFKNSLEEHGKLKINYSDGKISFRRNRRERTEGDITGESYTERKKRLIGEEDPIVVMDSTESFNSKKTLISRFGELREKIIQRATEKQKLAISQELPEQNNAKILNQDGSLIAELADSSDIRDGINSGKTFDKKLEEDIIPILDLMEANPLDKDVAVVVDIGDIKGSKNPNRMTFLEFVNFVRAGIALNKQKYQTDDFPQTNQKMVVKVPKGSRGIPDFDFAPNSNKDKSISETLSEALSKMTDDDIYGGPEGKIRPYRGEGENDLELTDADVEELYKRYEKDRDLRKKQRKRRQIPKTTPEEEEAAVARERILGMASVRQGLRSGSAPVINSQDSRGSIASMLLAPGKIKIEGEREDGTLVGRLIQQNTPMQSLSKLENKLQAVIDNPGANGSHKVEAERALNVIKARKNAESNIGLRSSSNQSRDYVREMPSTINYNSQQILERLEDNGATWGEPLSDALAEMNQNPIEEIIVRTTNEKIEQGPKILINGRDKNGTPLMAGVENLQKEFGKTNAEINNYFIKKHGVRIDIQDKFLSAQGSDGQKQKSVIYGALQAINDLFENINIKSLTKRDNLKISFSDFITGENSLGEFGPKEKLFSRTTFGDNKTKSRVLINQNAISEMSMQRVWLDMKSSDSKINHVDQFFAKLGIPKGFDPIFPGEDSPDFEKWQSLENQFLQRIAYGIAIHEIAHYLDFTQRDPGDNPVSVPPSLRKLITGKKPEGRLDDGLFQSTSSGVSESLRDMPSVSKYGLTNNQEKLAEGFLSWFLFGGTKLGTTPVSGDRTSYRYEQNAEKFQETVSGIVTPLLEKLGPRVKSAKQTNKTSSSATTNELPAQIFVYAILPFIKMFENRNLDKNMSKKYLNGFDIKALSSSNAQKISDSTKYEQDQDSMVFIDKEIKKLLLAIKKDKKLNKKILPNVLKEIQSMTDTELKTALVKASRQFVAGLDKRPRYFFNDNNENLEITNSNFDKFVKRGSWDSNSEKQNDTTVIDSEYGVRLGIPKGAEDAVNPVRGFLLHSDEIKNRKIKIQAEVEKKKNNFEKRGINPQKIKPEYLPQSIYLGLHGTKDSLNPFPIQRGETEIILKPEIAHRTLATFGDSVSGARTPFNLDNEDNDERLLVAMLRNRWLDNEQNGNTSSVKLTTQQKIINLLNAYIGKIGYGDVTKDEDGARGFVEAIIAGGFNLDEVEEIHLSANYVKKHINIQLNEPDLTEATKILTRFSIKNDLINAENIILNPKTPEETRAAGEMKKKIIYIQQLKKQREARIKFSRKINSAVRGGVGPKIIFVNEDGLDYDDPKTYKNYIDGMTVDELLDERMASDIREILKTIGKPVASSEQVIAFRRENNKMKTGVNS